jgi:hypothetical protein
MNEPSVKCRIDLRSREVTLPAFRQLPNYRQQVRKSGCLAPRCSDSPNILAKWFLARSEQHQAERSRRSAAEPSKRVCEARSG